MTACAECGIELPGESTAKLCRRCGPPGKAQPTQLADLLDLVRAADAKRLEAEKDRDYWKRLAIALQNELNKLRGRLAAIQALKEQG